MLATAGSWRFRVTQSIPAITALQENYVKAVINAVNDLDNVIYEISNESDESANAWQYHMIDFIRSYEATKTKQHPIGMTVPWPATAPDASVFGSGADWVSMEGDVDNPIEVDGTKVSLWDTDHLCGICGSSSAVWKAITKGHNPLLMDGYDGSAGVGDPMYNPNDPKWEQIRTTLGWARSYAARMDLKLATPHSDFGTEYCLANWGVQYLVFLPSGGKVTLNLGAPGTGTLNVEWFNPTTGVATSGGTVTKSRTASLTPPFSGPAVLFLY